MAEENVQYVEEQGITFGEIFKRIWKAKLVLGITGVTTCAVALLGVHFAYSKPSREYISEAKLSFAGINNDKYPDGTNFYYQNIISYENLAKVKDSSSEYADIDVAKIVDKDGISIEQKEKTTYAANGQEMTDFMKDTFILKVKSSYFSSDTQAKHFVNDLFSQPLELASNYYTNITYDYNLKIFDSQNTYESQVSLINAQRDLLINGYNGLIENYGNKTVVDPNTNANVNLKDYVSEISNYFAENPVSYLSTLLEVNGYVKDASFSKVIFEAQIEQLTKKKDDNTRKINELTAKFQELYGTSVDILGSSAEMANQIRALISENVDIDRQLIELNKKLVNINASTYAAPAFFTEALSNYISKLTTYTEVYTVHSKAINKENITVTYTNPNYITKDGGLSVLIEGVLSLVVGALVGAVAAYCVGTSQLKKEEKKEVEAK